MLLQNHRPFLVKMAFSGGENFLLKSCYFCQSLQSLNSKDLMLQVSEFVILRLVCSTGHDPALFSGRPGQSAQCRGEGGHPRAQGLHHIPGPLH